VQLLKSQTKSETTRLRILGAAARVLASDGYARAKLSDIATRADTHAGGLYYYFSSREELVEEVVRLAGERFIEGITGELSTLPEQATSRERLALAIRVGVKLILSEDDYTKAYLKVYTELPEEARVRLRPLQDAYHDVFRRLIEDAQVAGDIRPDLDPSALRMLILGSITWSRQWYSKSGTHSIAEIGNQAVTLFLDGLCPPLAKPAKRATIPSTRRTE
jgi:AcrR family transcriptional regulator